jgi:hypothetical protein
MKEIESIKKERNFVFKCGCQIVGTAPYVEEVKLCEQHSKEALKGAVELLSRKIYEKLI